MLDQGLQRLFDLVAGLGRPCMIGGSVAASLHGEPRTTLDIDIVIDLEATPETIAGLHAAFPSDSFYLLPDEVLLREIRRGSKGQFNVIDHASGMKADIYPAGNDELNHYGLAHREKIEVDGLRLIVAPATYIVAMKLRYWAISQQDKHLRDIRGVVAVSGGDLDLELIGRMADACGARAAWDDCRRRAGEE